MINLISMFDLLQPPSATENINVRFATYTIPGYEQHRLGKDSRGRPALLISTAQISAHVRPAPIVLEHLTVQYNINCCVSQIDGKVEEEVFTVIHCIGDDIALFTHFLRISSAVIEALGPVPSHIDVTHAVNRLVELFRSMKTFPKKSIQGLWAELFLINRARNPSQLIKAWHLSLEDRYDFNAGDQRIEVKSVAGRVRQHHFSLEQLVPPKGTQVLIASMLIERSGAGASVVHLIDELRPRISNHVDTLLHVDRIVNFALGTNWRGASEEKFDRELAEQSLAFFEPSSIPMVSPNLPVGVSEVHFKADLTTCSPIDLARLRKLGGLFSATLRR